MSDKDENSFEYQIKNSAYVGIVGYAGLLMSTLFASGIFGMPRFVVSDMKWPLFKRVDDFSLFWKIISKFFIFFLVTVFGPINFVFICIKTILQGDIKKFVNLSQTHSYYYQSNIDLISIIVFACWLILLLRQIWQLNEIDKIIDEEEKE